MNNENITIWGFVVGGNVTFTFVDKNSCNRIMKKLPDWINVVEIEGCYTDCQDPCGLKGN